MAVSRSLQVPYESLRSVIDTSFSTITDTELDEIVRGINQQNPLIGIRTIMQMLRSNGLRVQRDRVRDALRRVDGYGAMVRRATVLRRRIYHVPHVNFLWHVDGNHRLIKCVMRDNIL